MKYEKLQKELDSFKRNVNKNFEAAVAYNNFRCLHKYNN